MLVLALVVGSAIAAPGKLDKTFSGDGKRLVSFKNGSSNFGVGVAVQDNGRPVIVGESDGNGTPGTFGVARLTRRGRPDKSFSGNGRVLTDFGNGPGGESPADVAIQANGRILVVGNANHPGMASSSGIVPTLDIALARYMPDGSLDKSFSGNGKQTIAIGDGEDSALGVAIQANGEIVIAGHSYVGSSSFMSVARLQTDGQLDHTFSGDGKRTISLSNGPSFGQDLAIQPNGRIVITGATRPSGGFDEVAVARLTANGGLDDSFSGNGRLRTAFEAGFGSTGGAVAIQPNGRILIGGTEETAPNTMGILRLTRTGSPDNSFSGDGKRVIQFPSDASASDLALQPNGRIVLGGSARSATGSDFALARVMPGGALDQSLGQNGRVTTSFGDSYDYIGALASLPNGKLVAAGSSQLTTTGVDFAVARYLGN